MTCSFGTMRFIVRKSLASPCPTKIAPKFTKSRNFLYAISNQSIPRGIYLKWNKSPLRCPPVQISLHQPRIRSQVIHNHFLALPRGNIIINKRDKNVVSPSSQYTHSSQPMSFRSQQFSFPRRCNLRLLILQKNKLGINSNQFLRERKIRRRQQSMLNFPLITRTERMKLRQREIIEKK